MKTTGQKLVAFLLTAFMAMSLMAVSLSGTAYAWMEKEAAADKCPPEGFPAFTVDLSPQAKGCAKEEELTEACANDPNKKTIPGVDLCGTADAAAKVAESKIAQESFQKLTSMLIGFESMINKLLWPVLMMTGDLMNNNILFGPGMEQKLYDIWVPVRNIVNIFFVIALIGLALYSVLGINSENGQYSIKAMLPKLIAGIIAVNFSFIAIKVVLDAVNVFTTAVFAIPTQVQGLDKAVLGNEDKGDDPRLRKAFCEQLYMDGKQFTGKNTAEFDKGVEQAALFMIRDRFSLGGVSDANTIKALGDKLESPKKEAFNAQLTKLKDEFAMCELNGDKSKLILSDAGLQFFQKYGQQNAALAMAINMGEIMFYNRVSISLIGSGTYESLAIKEIFIVLMYLIYGASFIAMFAVLLARLIVVWIGLAMSPVIALSIAVPMVKDKLGMGELTSKFMKHAIAPIMIAFPMMIGWVMLNALHSTSTDVTTVYGAKDMLIPGIPIPGLETLQGLLLSLATAAVVWMGVFAAAEGTIAGKVTGFMKERLESLGKFVATAPLKYTPWVPVQLQEGGKTESYSPMALLNAATKFQGDLEYQSGRKFIDAHPGLFPGGAAGGPASLGTHTTMNDLMTEISQNGKKMREKPEEYNKKIDELKLSLDLMSKLEEEATSGNKAAIATLKAIKAGDFKLLPGDAQNLASQYLKDHPQSATAASAASAEQTPDARAKTALGYGDKELNKEEKEKLKKTTEAIGKVDEAMTDTKIIDDETERKKVAEVLIKTVPPDKIDAVIDASASAKLKDDPEVGKKRADSLKEAVKKAQPAPAPTPAPTTVTTPPVSQPTEGGGGAAQPPPVEPPVTR